MIKFKNLVSVTLVLVLVVGFSMVFGGSVYAADTKASDSKSVKSAKININTAGKDQLMELPRIGDKMSDRIIQYRKENGKFKKTEDIMKVKGIGEKTFKNFEDKITV